MIDKKIIIGIIAGLVIVVSLVFSATGFVANDNPAEEKNKITVFKSQSCGCCVGWISYMNSMGFETETVMVDNISSVKEKYNVPNDMRSCHTAVIGNYFIEGHVSIEAINKMLEEKPDIDGIALPGMSSGSPGMPGTKSGELIIYSIKDGDSSEYMRV